MNDIFLFCLLCLFRSRICNFIAIPLFRLNRKTYLVNCYYSKYNYYASLR